MVPYSDWNVGLTQRQSQSAETSVPLERQPDDGVTHAPVRFARITVKQRTRRSALLPLLAPYW